jgi:conjugal transfer pilus assembly protein TraF
MSGFSGGDRTVACYKPVGLAAVVIVMGLLGWAEPSAWAERYWEYGKEGWFWYEDPPEAAAPVPPEPAAPPPAPPDPNDPAVRDALKRAPVDEAQLPRLPVKWLQALQDVKLERALEDFTPEAVREYLLVHREHFRRSQEFTDLWQLVIYTNPELDPAAAKPVSTAGLKVADQLAREDRERTLASYADRAGLYFFFRSSCPYCRQFAPILRLFSAAHGWRVFPVTQDGQTLPEFPDARSDNGMGEAIGVRTVPAVYLAVPEERFLAPVAQGFLTLAELEERVLTILRERGRMVRAAATP